MHTSIVVALLATLTVVSAGVPGLPSCASSCVGTSFGNCGALDVQCICSDSSLIASLACCVSKSCDAAGQAGERATMEIRNAWDLC